MKRMNERLAQLSSRALPCWRRLRSMIGLIALLIMSIILSPRSPVDSEIEVVDGSQLSATDWFALKHDGVKVIFEFEIVSVGEGHTVTEDSVEMKIRKSASADEVAEAVAAAINLANRDHQLKTTAIATDDLVLLDNERVSVDAKNTPFRLGESITFLSETNITNILRQVSEIGIMALAMTFVILSAGIDLSVGSVLALSASLVAMLLTKWSPEIGATWHILIAVAVAIGAAGLVGAINGLVIAKLRIQPFIVTLAAMIGIRGLAKWLTDNANIDIGFGEDVSAVFASLISTKLFVIGTFSCLAMIFGIVLARTVFGRYVRALGDNLTATLYSGLPAKRLQVWVYTLSGLLAGVAGVLHAAQNHQGSPNAGVAYELDVIAAVVIGGTSLAGGKGTIFGTIVGTLIMGVLTNILGLNNVDDNVQRMIKAVIIIAAVFLQRTDRR